jgi:hypothetical protein
MRRSALRRRWARRAGSHQLGSEPVRWPARYVTALVLGGSAPEVDARSEYGSLRPATTLRDSGDCSCRQAAERGQNTPTHDVGGRDQRDCHQSSRQGQRQT